MVFIVDDVDVVDRFQLFCLLANSSSASLDGQPFAESGDLVVIIAPAVPSAYDCSRKMSRRSKAGTNGEQLARPLPA